MDPRLSPDQSILSPDSGMMDISPDDNEGYGDREMTGSNFESPTGGTPSSTSNATMTAAPTHDAAGLDSNASKRKRFVKVVEVDAPNNLDLDTYIANYKGMFLSWTRQAKKSACGGGKIQFQTVPMLLIANICPLGVTL